MQTSSQGTVRRWSSLLGALLCLLLTGAAWAQRVEGDRAAAQGAYEAEVAVRNQTDEERRKAFARGLLQVLTNVTGDREVGRREGVREALATAEDSIAGFDYRQDEGLSATGAPSFQTMLVLRFKQEAVDELVALLGLPSWPLPHPKPVLWLAIDDGSGPRLVGLGQVNVARSVLDAAKARGYALGLPAGNAAEQAGVGAIWRGDTAAVAALSKRYSPPMQLIGKLQRSAGGWRADWTFVDNGKVLANWQTTHADARRAMAGGADGAADALFKRYAKAGSGIAPKQYQVRILGVDSSDDYLRLAAWLEAMPGLRRVLPLTATPGVLELELEQVGGLTSFGRYAGRGGVLVAVGGSSDAGAGAPATFRLGGE